MSGTLLAATSPDMVIGRDGGIQIGTAKLRGALERSVFVEHDTLTAQRRPGQIVGEARGGTAGAVADAGIGVAVAEEPQANMAANSNAKGPKTMNFGFLNQCFKMDEPPTLFWDCGDRMP